MSPALVPPSTAVVGRAALFFYRLGMTLMSCHHIDFVAFDLAAEGRHGLPLDDPVAKLGGHLLCVIGIAISLVADRFIGAIQPQEIAAEDPDPQRLVMAGEDRPGPVIEGFLTGRAVRALSLGLGPIVTLCGDRSGVAMGTSYAVGPAQLADGFQALQVVDEVLDVDHRP